MTYIIESERADGTWARDGYSDEYETREDAENAIAELIESGETDGAFDFRVTEVAS